MSSSAVEGSREADAIVGGKTEDSRPKVLLAASGSVATIKLVEIATILSPHVQLRVVTTKCANHFFDPAQLPPDAILFSDEEEWSSWTRIPDPILHIELRKWADLIIIAPLGANTMGKLANGLCDNLLTSVARAWNFKRPFLVAPAMNTFMWFHPVTDKQISLLKEFGVEVIEPVSKKLACGDVGMGAMASVENIVNAVLEKLKGECI